MIGQCQNRHRHQEWLKFLQQIDAETPADRDLHLILDNYATHKHPKVKQWLAKHPRFHLHFTPTSASWLNIVERFFRDLTVNRLRRGVFHYADRPSAERRLKELVAAYSTSAPKLASWLEANLHEGFTVFAFPAAHQRRLRTSNALERVNQELKRRTRVVSIFPNEASLLRLVSALLTETSDDWESSKSYLNMLPSISPSA